MSRNTVKRPAKTATVAQAQGPKRRRLAATLPEQLDGDACREVLSFLIHSQDEASVFQKMKMTFQYRQDVVHDPQRTTDVFKTFPRFLDVKGLLNQDFLLLFGAETASKMLEKWDTTFRPKVINEAKHLTQSVELCRLRKAAEKLTENDDTTWGSDMASLLLLLHLLPPTAGRKRTKISPSDAVDKMLHFHKSGTGLTPSTLLWTNSSSPAKPLAHWVRLMNCLNPTTCSTCRTMNAWASSSPSCKQQFITLM